MSFASYKKNRTDLSKLTKKVEDLDQGGKSKFKDDRFWSPSVDKAGNGAAVIRFLAAPEGEDLPWVQYHEHNFDINGSYFIELCPTTLGRECPVCKANSALWKTEIKENQDIARGRKRALRYVSNIYVLKDKENPENEGKVFLFRYGQKIFEKIKNQLKPKDEEDAPVNVFDLYDGADFRLEIKNVAGFRNYDDSTFRNPAPLLKGDDQKLEAIYNSLNPLAPFIAEEKFKSFDDLEKKFQDVSAGPKAKVQKKADELFGEDSPKSAAPKARKERKAKEESEDSAPWEDAVRKPGAKKTAPKTEETEEEVDLEGEESLDYYNELADKD
jgi:hypothetical protein